MVFKAVVSLAAKRSDRYLGNNYSVRRNKTFLRSAFPASSMFFFGDSKQSLILLERAPRMERTRACDDHYEVLCIFKQFKKSIIGLFISNGL